MISFELIGPLTLETFSGRAGHGGRVGRTAAAEIAWKSSKTVRNQRNISGNWGIKGTLAEIEATAREGDWGTAKEWRIS